MGYVLRLEEPVFNQFKSYSTKVSAFLNEYDSQENAYLVEDYPYGFKLRCKIRFWIEYGGEKKGWRFCSQTTNPKSDQEQWNKPKYSTYSLTAMVMFLNEENHVVHDCLGEYLDENDLRQFLSAYEKGLSAFGLNFLKRRLRIFELYNSEREKGLDHKEAFIAAMKKFRQEDNTNKKS